MKQPLGVILAGGLARRMGGGDKGRLMLQGQSMISRVVERLAPQVAQVGLNANGDPNRFEDLGLPVFCLLYTSPSPRDQRGSRMPSSA